MRPSVRWPGPVHRFPLAVSRRHVDVIKRKKRRARDERKREIPHMMAQPAQLSQSCIRVNVVCERLDSYPFGVRCQRCTTSVPCSKKTGGIVRVGSDSRAGRPALLHKYITRFSDLFLISLRCSLLFFSLLISILPCFLFRFFLHHPVWLAIPVPNLFWPSSPIIGHPHRRSLSRHFLGGLAGQSFSEETSSLKRKRVQVRGPFGVDVYISRSERSSTFRS